MCALGSKQCAALCGLSYGQPLTSLPCLSWSQAVTEGQTVSPAHSLFPAWTHGGWKRTWRTEVGKGTIKVHTGDSRRLPVGRGCPFVTTAPQEPSSALDQAGTVQCIKLSRQLLLPQHAEGNLCSGDVRAAHAATQWRGPKGSHSEGHLLPRRRKSILDPSEAHGNTHLSSHLICTQPGLRRNDQG